MTVAQQSVILLLGVLFYSLTADSWCAAACGNQSFRGAEKQAAAFHEQGAIEALLEMLRMFKPDEVFLRHTMRSLVALCGYDGETDL